ncbi:hypothetical protein N7481_006777 [Penicillium waksmanii]|uniref:uncharacterized protein n=1 Tax=Penicillium waksmanii TaxID=69791 RepID=UPI002548AADC|nr:uncharacterized protein N7481_006777 [Penicillium waksmanii]KAJ5984678.1 hypothetical protein N7481_006777 [Penicillium waksmanii]
MDSLNKKLRKCSISYHSEFSKPIVCDDSGGVEVVKAGTLAALVDHLTRHDKLDASFNRTFLTTYKYFISTNELIRLLIDQFDGTPPDLNPTQAAEWSNQIKPLVRLRVINIFKQWLESFWGDSSRCDATVNQDLLEIKAFVYRINDASEAVAARQLLSIIQCRLEGVVNIKTIQPFLSSAPKPILPKKLNKLQFLKIDPKEIARQLTIMESSMFAKIQRSELLNKSWQKRDTCGGPGSAPHIRASIRYSNQVSNWVVALIIAESELKKRTQVIGHFINVASACRDLQNYSTVISILSGLESAPIYRLSRTWAMVTERSCNTLSPMQAMISSTQNYNAYRETIRAAVPPCIPFLGLFLKDLTFIEDGNPGLTSEGLINFHKYTMLASTIQDVQRFKEAPYCLQPVPELQEYLATELQSAVELHELWPRSCELEPRSRGDESRLRDRYTATGGNTTSMVVACMVMDQ